MEKTRVALDGRIPINEEFFVDLCEVTDDRTQVDFWLGRTGTRSAHYLTTAKRKAVSDSFIKNLLDPVKLEPMMQAMR